MHRLSALFLCLMLVLSLGFGSIAHATEGVRCVNVTVASSLDHSEGDADQVPSDTDKGYPHHHGGCHGHHVGVPLTAAPLSRVSGLSLTLFASNAAPRPPVSSDAALRPPRT